MLHRFGDERAGTAGRIQRSLVQRVVDQLAHHCPGQPRWGVVFAQGPPFVGRDHRFVENGGDVWRGVLPVEPGHPSRQRPHQILPTHFIGPSEEVRFDNAAQPRGVPEPPALQKVRRVGFRQLPQVNAKGRLDCHADDEAEVSVPYEQVVQFLRVLGDFSQRGAQQVLPQPPFHLDRLVLGRLSIHPGQGVSIPLVGGAARAEVFLHVGPVHRLAFQRDQRAVPQPLVQQQPLVTRFQHEPIGRCGPHRTGPGPSQQPILAIGENARAHALAVGFGDLQVVIQLPHVGGIGIEAAGGSDALLELDEGVQRGEINGASTAGGWRILLDDLLAAGQPRDDEEIAHGGGDVRLGFTVVVPVQDGLRRVRVPRVVGVKMRSHNSIVSPGFLRRERPPTPSGQSRYNRRTSRDFSLCEVRFYGSAGTD